MHEAVWSLAWVGLYLWLAGRQKAGEGCSWAIMRMQALSGSARRWAIPWPTRDGAELKEDQRGIDERPPGARREVGALMDASRPPCRARFPRSHQHALPARGVPGLEPRRASPYTAKPVHPPRSPSSMSDSPVSAWRARFPTQRSTRTLRPASTAPPTSGFA